MLSQFGYLRVDLELINHNHKAIGTLIRFAANFSDGKTKLPQLTVKVTHSLV